MGHNVLWYSQPAANWNEALPIGNGDLGAMVFGSPLEERLQLNIKSLWDGHPQDRVNPQALEALPEVRRLIFQGQNENAARLAERTMMGVPPTIDSYQTLGDLHIRILNHGSVSGYRRDLDLNTAAASTRFTLASPVPIEVERQVFCSSTDGVLVVRFHASKPIDLECSLDRPENFSTTNAGSYQIQMFGRAGTVGVRYHALLGARTDSGAIQAGSNLTVSHARDLTLVFAAATDYNLADPAHPLQKDLFQTCQHSVQAALSHNPDRLYQDHERSYKQLFDRVHLDLGHTPNELLPTDQRLANVANGVPDPALAALYFQFGRYLMISCSRGGLPANLQGLWCQDLKAPWNADFHTNINLQMNYWPVEVANLSECHLPLLQYVERLARSGTDTAKRMYGARGWVVHHLSDAWGFTVPADGVWGIWPVGGAWLAQHPWEHYLFTHDLDFLKRSGYPVMKGAALFMLDYLVEAPDGSPVAGRLVTNPSHSPENSFCLPDGTVSQFTYGATMDLEIAHDLFTNCISAIEVLKQHEPGYDSAFESQLRSALQRLAPLQISSKTGRLQEWIDDYDEPEPGHRHMSHLFGLHPGHQISLDTTPELAAAARRSLEFRLSHGGGHTGWSRAWIINFYARFQEPEKVNENLVALLSHSTQPNLLDSHPPFQIDGNFGACAGIAEALLQSQGSKIQLLPALPSDWKNGRISGLRARGGFEVGMEWQNGILTHASLKSIAGAGSVHLRLPANVQVDGSYLQTGRDLDLSFHKAIHLSFSPKQ